MPTTGRAIVLLAATVIVSPGIRPDGGVAAQATGRGAQTVDRVAAGGVVPPANALSGPRPANLNPDAGATLFSAMNCDGCHGGGAVGWVGPSLVDGRWRHGGTDDEIFTSVFYGRPKGMPAYGGVIGPEGVWNLVAYIRAQGVPTVVPTTSWLEGGNAAPTPGPAHEGEAPPGDAAPVPPAKPAAAPAPPPSVAPEQMLTKYGCTACHATDRKIVGPSFKDVANKYRGQNAEAALAQKIKKGGGGVWGDVPMIPNPQVPDPDLRVLVKWILSLK